MAFTLNPMDTLKGWGNALTTPFGIILLVLLAIYIYLRISGRIEGLGGMINKGKGGNSGNVGGARKPDYILK